MFRSAFHSTLGLLVLLSCLNSVAQAGVTGGTVESYSPETGQMTVKLINDKTESFTVESIARVEWMRKKLDRTKIAVGQRVSVYTTASGKVYKVAIRSMSKTPTTKPGTPSENPVPKPQPRVSTKPTATNDGGWAQFRGPNRDNHSPDTGLLKDWTQSPPKPLWQAKNIGEGYSSVSIADGKVFTMGTRNNSEMVFAFDLNTGRELWASRNSTVRNDGQGNGPRSTPAFDNGRLYALGANGDLGCFDANTGKGIWQKNILTEFGGRNIGWGISESVLIDGEKIICTPGGKDGTMVALDKSNGGTVWKCEVPGSPRAAYSSPVIAEVDGVKQYVTFTHSSVIGVRDDGTFLWQNNSSANGTANCSTPVYENGYLFSASGYGTGGTLLKLGSSGNRTSAQQLYHTDNMKNHHGGMVIVDGYLYGTDDPGILTCIELKTGDIKWKDRSVGKGSVVYADGNLYLRSERGPMALVEATPTEYVEKGRFDQPQRSGRPAWSHPVVYDGKLFLRDQDNLLVYNLKPGR